MLFCTHCGNALLLKTQTHVIMITAQIKLAVSHDLYSWWRFPKDVGGLLFTDICVARDPQLVAPAAGYGDEWIM